MAEMESAPAFTFRHGTVLDKNNFALALTEEGIVFHNDQAIRDRIVSELRLMFESEDMERNITRLEAYWQAGDDLKAALDEHNNYLLAILADLKEGDEPQLPPPPTFDFDEKEARDIELLIAQVNEESAFLRLMRKQNLRYRIEFPNLLLRMMLTETTIPVTLKRKDGLITKACIEELLEAFRKEAKRLGADPELALSQLNAKAMMQFRLTEDEEKNSSSPLSDTTSPEQSASTPSTGPQTTPSTESSDPVTGDSENGSNS